MAFDFLTLIVVIFIIFLTVVGLLTRNGVWNLITVPMLLYLIVYILEHTEGGTTLPILALAGFIAFQVYFVLHDYIGGHEE